MSPSLSYLQGRFGSSLSLVALAAGLAFAGCGEDESSDENSTTNNQAQVDAGGDVGCEGALAPSEYEYASSYDMRFTKLAFDQGTPISSLNGLLSSEFNDQRQPFPPAVLFKVDSIDKTAGSARVRAGAGLKVDQACDPAATSGECEYLWDPEQPSEFYDADFNAETGLISGVLEEFLFVATFEVGDTDELEKAEIRIEELQFEAVVAPNCDGGVEIVEGDLAGRITKEDADAVQIRLTPTGQPLVLGSFIERNHELDLDVDEDGVNDAWQLDASFDAKESRIQAE